MNDIFMCDLNNNFQAFLRYLKTENIFLSFQKQSIKKRVLDCIKGDYSFSSIIDHCLVWGETEEGFDYWDKLYDKLWVKEDKKGTIIL